MRVHDFGRTFCHTIFTYCQTCSVFYPVTGCYICLWYNIHNKFNQMMLCGLVIYTCTDLQESFNKTKNTTSWRSQSALSPQFGRTSVATRWLTVQPERSCGLQQGWIGHPNFWCFTTSCECYYFHGINTVGRGS